MLNDNFNSALLPVVIQPKYFFFLTEGTKQAEQNRDGFIHSDSSSKRGDFE